MFQAVLPGGGLITPPPVTPLHKRFLPEKLRFPQLIKKFPRILWNVKTHYFVVHNSLPVVAILSQMKPGHACPSHLLKIHFNIILSNGCLFEAVLSSSDFPIKTLSHFSSPHVPNASTLPFFLV
jgi:hypothetical protein